ncbi:hypothetical protein CEP54_012730 [Fusarium duplospermum]|uniref:N-acetyltransferase domain-containing protein n=1 Tax=Fusarium duplospermum TaxID=1325734 RepID=A0A428P709_9HYPO|nr:hypothetical protein CEP54_012730 [Fusarium duplospermum]
MVSSKRSASPLEGAILKTNKKSPSRSPDSTADSIEEPADMPVRIIVSARSDYKAERNDPESSKYLGRRDKQAKSQTQAASSGDQTDPSHSSTSNHDSELGEETKALSNLIGLPFHDDFANVEWLEQIDGLAFAKGNWIGYCEAKLIRRLQIRRKFSIAMEEPTRGTSELAFELFDRYGRLRKEFREHTFNKGTGVWGNELSSEDILLLEYIRIEPEHQRQKIGTQLVNAVLSKARRKSTKFFVLAKPRYIMEGEITEVERPHKMVVATEAAERFFRSMGFKRVGSPEQIESLAILQGVNICDLDRVSKDIISRVFTTPKYEFQSIPGATEIQTTLRLKYGCTCGQCLGGFLSPRMQYALRKEGYLQMKALTFYIGHGPIWLESHKSELERVSPKTREFMENYKFIREGFVKLSKHLTTCIEQDRIPNKTNLLEICNGSGKGSESLDRTQLKARGALDAA